MFSIRECRARRGAGDFRRSHAFMRRPAHVRLREQRLKAGSAHDILTSRYLRSDRACRRPKSSWPETNR
jgi:hypothetical protein